MPRSAVPEDATEVKADKVWTSRSKHPGDFFDVDVLYGDVMYRNCDTHPLFPVGDVQWFYVIVEDPSGVKLAITFNWADKDKK